MPFRTTLPLALLAALVAAFALSYSALSAASTRDEPARSAALAEVPVVGETPERLTPEAPEAAAQSAPPRSEPKPKRRWRSLASSARRGHAVAVVRRTVPLRVRPNGRATARAYRNTEFGSTRVMSIAAQRGPWLGVVTPELPNGRLAWVHIENKGLAFRRTRYSLRLDLSRRRLELRKGGRTLRRITVGIGRPGSETPTGRFAVTDKLRGSAYGSYYGCCILALNGNQPNLPPGWTGGDRLAIHGTDAPSTIGTAVSAGCPRASAADLAVLMRRVPLGTPVFIRR